MSDEVTTTTDAPAEAGPRKLNPYEVRTLSVALAAQARTGWCNEGLNESLRELGLPEKPSKRYMRQFITVPTTGSVRYEFSGASKEEALAQVQRYNGANARYNRLEYGQRGGPLQFDMANAVFEGFDGDSKTPEEIQWESAMEQVKAYRAGNPDAADDEDDEDDD